MESYLPRIVILVIASLKVGKFAQYSLSIPLGSLAIPVKQEAAFGRCDASDIIVERG